jgi:hypothetical protein
MTSLIKTPNEILLEQAGIPHMAEGRSVGDMQADLIAQGYTPPKFADGKSVAPAQKSIIFNVGKDVNGVKNVLTHEQILNTMKSLGLDPQHAHVVFAQPDKEFGPFEDTLVVKAKGNPNDLHLKTHILAEHLNQDAIPAKLEGAASGVLAGPKADAWGSYNPSYFVEHGTSSAAGNNPGIIENLYTKAKTALTPSIENQKILKNIGSKLGTVGKYAGNAANIAGVAGEALEGYKHIAEGEPEKAVNNVIGAGSMLLPPQYGLPIAGLMHIKNLPPDTAGSALDLTNKVSSNPEYLQNID